MRCVASKPGRWTSSRENSDQRIGRARELEAEGRISIVELGTGLDPDAFGCNLTPTFAQRQPVKAQWLQSLAFRQAVSIAVDRAELVRTVYTGAGVPIAGPVTPGNRLWHHDGLLPPKKDLGRSKSLLASIGLVDRDGDGFREDSSGEVVRFSLLTQRGHTIRERTAAFLEQDVEARGIAVDVVTLDPPALVARLTAGDFEVALFVVQSSDTDPAANLDFWQSTGPFHLWHPSQPAPATEWEGQLDRLMSDELAAIDVETRRRLFPAAPELLAESSPILHFAAPTIRVGVSPRIEGLRPGLLRPHVL